jgi:shikimate kinase
MQGIVLATGGGAILREESRNLLKKNGIHIRMKSRVNLDGGINRFSN